MTTLLSMLSSSIEGRGLLVQQRCTKMASPSSSLLKRRALHERERNGEPVSRPTKQEETDYERPVKTEDSQHNTLELLAVLYHFSMTVFYALCLYYSAILLKDKVHIIDPAGKIPAYGGRFKFLTHINQWFQLGFFGLQFLTDLLPRSQLKDKLQNLCDLFFTTIAVPIALFIVITFWAIYAIDRSLVYPVTFDLVVPQYLNHFWHTTIAVWVLFETFLCVHRYPSTGTAATMAFAVNAAYLSWIVWVYVKTNFWVYGILKVLPLPLMSLFCGGCIFFSFGLYFVGKAIANKRWGQTLYIE